MSATAKVDYVISSEWDDGFVLEVFVTNTGTDTLSDYTVDFSVPGNITDMWSGDIVSQDGNQYRVSDDSLAPGETGRFKFKAEKTSNDSLDDIQFTVDDGSQSNTTTDTTTPSYNTEGSIVTVDESITASQLNDLIATVDDGTTIHLRAGDYSFDDQITIERDNITLEGEGSDKTHITMVGDALNDDHAFYVKGRSTDFIGHSLTDLKQGDSVLSMDNTKDIQTGDVLRIWEDNTDEYLDSIGDTAWREMNAPLRTSMAVVKSVDGNQITLDRGIHFDFDANDTKVEHMDVRENVNLSGFTVDYNLGESTPGLMENTLSDLTDYQAVKFDGSYQSSVSDVQVIEGPSSAFEIALSLDFSGDRLQAHGAHNKGSGGNGYAFEMRELYNSELTHLADSNMRHSALFASWRSSVGNTVQVDSTDRDINFHGGRDHDNSVHVNESYRAPDEDTMSTTLWYNDGGHSWGAITDPNANTITFDKVIGTKRDDYVPASENGVTFDGADGDDTVKLLFNRDEYSISTEDDYLVFDHDGTKDHFTNIESFVFKDGSEYSVEDIQNEIQTDNTQTVVPELATVSSEEVEITTNVTSEWNGGYVAEVFVTNTTSETIDSPVVHMEMPENISDLWNGNKIQTSDGYDVEGINAGSVLEPNEQWRFSFKVDGDDHTLPTVTDVQGEVDGQLLILGVNTDQTQ